MGNCEWVGQILSACYVYSPIELINNQHRMPRTFPSRLLAITLTPSYSFNCLLPPKDTYLAVCPPTILDVRVILNKSSDACYALIHFIFLVAVAEANMLKIALLHLYVDFVCFVCTFACDVSDCLYLCIHLFHYCQKLSRWKSIVLCHYPCLHGCHI